MTKEMPDKDYIKRQDGSDIYLGPFAKEVWNLAIEQAAISVGKLPYSTEACAVIRGLKK
jgi:hypothetical protein